MPKTYAIDMELLKTTVTTANKKFGSTVRLDVVRQLALQVAARLDVMFYIPARNVALAGLPFEEVKIYRNILGSYFGKRSAQAKKKKERAKAQKLKPAQEKKNGPAQQSLL